jgi:sirohydrochlorin ferrochelatase
MKAILLIDHGSVRAEANHMLVCMANLVRAMAGDGVIVEHAHMELAEPSIDDGVAACVRHGATEVVAFPYMLSPGKHSTRDIPRMVQEAARAHPGVAVRVTPAFGVHEKLAELVLLRAGVAPTQAYVEDDAADAAAGAEAGVDGAACCWDPSSNVGACGDACRARQAQGARVAAAEGGAVRA